MKLINRVNSIFHDPFRSVHLHLLFDMYIIFIFHSFQFSSVVEFHIEYQQGSTGIEIKQGRDHQFLRLRTNHILASNVAASRSVCLHFFLDNEYNVQGTNGICFDLSNANRNDTMHTRECLRHVHGPLKNFYYPIDAITVTTRRLFVEY